MVKVGDKFTSNQGHTCVVVEYLNNKNITIEYPSGHRVVTQGVNLKKGAFKDQWFPSTHSVGVLGYEPFRCLDQYYTTWSNMLRRVYFPKENEVQAYADVLITPEWTYLTEFRKWFESQIYEPGWHLEKDLLVKGNFIYCPEHCIFVPQEINNLLTKPTIAVNGYPVGVHYCKAKNTYIAQISRGTVGKCLGSFDTPEEAFYVYKQAKELYIKDVANKWRLNLDPRAYEALMCYKIEISD